MLGFGSLGELALGEITLLASGALLPGGGGRRKRRRGLPFRVSGQQPAEAPQPKPQVLKKEPVAAPRLPEPISTYYGELWRPIDAPEPPWRAAVTPAPTPPVDLAATAAAQSGALQAARDAQDMADAQDVMDALSALSALFGADDA